MSVVSCESVMPTMLLQINSLIGELDAILRNAATAVNRSTGWHAW
ncbi:hypothetical protein [Variovorax ginsengisoli]|uniref:Uncharacterized protein n=1 Tax=Variovorax ginsengisoli TaxID=363844 RepID=A0ABT9S6M2_9BURK|nr:hypothetical protein [Variovorax ginsengisoli]MDP9900009.1 hypothetical protein [Variovorax ginsengisoli]